MRSSNLSHGASGELLRYPEMCPRCCLAEDVWNRRWWAWCLHVHLQSFEKPHGVLPAEQLPKPCIFIQSPVLAPSCEPEPLSNPECRICWWCWWRALSSLDGRCQWWLFNVYFPFMYLFWATGPAGAVWLAALVSWLAGLAVEFRFCQCAQKTVLLPCQMKRMVEIKEENNTFKLLFRCLDKHRQT